MRVERVILEQKCVPHPIIFILPITMVRYLQLPFAGRSATFRV